MILDLQGLWVKLGQYMSTRADALPESWIFFLSRLQDSMPARPLKEVKVTITRALGVDSDKVFESIESKAIAAASIAQVHRAVLKEGGLTVAIKVQHSHIAEMMHSDLVIFGSLLYWMGLLMPNMSLKPVLEEWSKEVSKELDFRIEAENMTRVRHNMMKAGLPATVPRVIEKYVSREVLVMRFIDGSPASIPPHKMDRLGVDRELLAARVCTAVAHQIYVDGFFNGDPHPGNILIQRRGDHFRGDPTDDLLIRAQAAGAPSTRLGTRMPSQAAGLASDGVPVPHRMRNLLLKGPPEEYIPIMLDFGMTKELEAGMRIAFGKMVVGVETVDFNLVLEAFDEMGMRFSTEDITSDVENL